MCALSIFVHEIEEFLGCLFTRHTFCPRELQILGNKCQHWFIFLFRTLLRIIKNKYALNYECRLLSIQHTALLRFSVKPLLLIWTSALHLTTAGFVSCVSVLSPWPVLSSSSSDHVSEPGYLTIRSSSSSLGFTVRTSVCPSNFFGLSSLFSILTSTSATHR